MTWALNLTPVDATRLCMCNLYSITTNQAAIIALFRAINRYVGNLPPMPGGVFERNNALARLKQHY